MSTKCSIKWRERTETQPGFHLYDDVMDSWGMEERAAGGKGSVEPPVYLHLNGVQVQVETLDSGGAAVTLALPRALARELGLLALKET